MFRRRAQSAESFWEWFQKDARRHERAPLKLVNQIGAQLRRYHPGLVCEMSPRKSGPHTLVISADGIAEYAEWVERLCDASPALEHWVVQRFRAPSPDFASVVLTYNGIELRIADVRFTAARDGVRVAVNVYAPWRHDTNQTNPDGPTFIMLDHTIGEYSVMFGIGEINVLPLELAPEGAVPWVEFPGVFESLFNHGEGGQSD